MLVSTTFRTHDEAIALANNTRYGLAASVWSENINVALDAAARIKAGVVWINSTNLFDAAAGFGGYRESGFGREGGREGFTNIEAGVAGGPQACRRCAPLGASPVASHDGARRGATPELDHTAKLYVGGNNPARRRQQQLHGVRRQRQAAGQAGLGKPQGHPQRR